MAGIIAFFAMTPAAKKNFITNFLNSNSNIPNPNPQTTSFTSGQKLGEGSNGVAGLWLGIDGRGHIVERVVIKDIQIAPADYHAHHWYYTTAAGRWPIEVYCHQICCPVANAAPSNIIGYKGYTTTAATCTWRIYSEYAAHGSLDDLIKNNRARKMVKKGSKTKFEKGMKKLPEPFLWHVFEGLAKAAQDMRDPPTRLQAGQPTGVNGGNNGRQVVHQDLKPSNVFLGDRTPGNFEVYPQVKVGDFGAARFTVRTETRTINPTFFFDDGHTPGFKPPELHATVPPLPLAQPPGFGPPLVRALEYTNVFQIGMIMRCLMRLDNEAIQADPSNHIDYLTAPPAQWTVALTNLAGNGYSSDLVNIVRDCLLSDVALRPTVATGNFFGPGFGPGPVDLLTRINLVKTPHLEGMEARAWPLVWNHKHSLDRLNNVDKYRVGMRAGRFPRV